MIRFCEVSQDKSCSIASIMMTSKHFWSCKGTHWEQKWSSGSFEFSTSRIVYLSTLSLVWHGVRSGMINYIRLKQREDYLSSMTVLFKIPFNLPPPRHQHSYMGPEVLQHHQTFQHPLLLCLSVYACMYVFFVFFFKFTIFREEAYSVSEMGGAVCWQCERRTRHCMMAVCFMSRCIIRNCFAICVGEPGDTWSEGHLKHEADSHYAVSILMSEVCENW